MRVEDFDYDLPEERIAQEPLADRAKSRLMVADPKAKQLTHVHFSDLPKFLNPGDVLVFNNSKVIPARLFGVKEDTGAKVELLLTREVNARETIWQAMAKPAKRLRIGTRLLFYRAGADGEDEARIGTAEVVSVLDEGLRELKFSVPEGMEAFLNEVGVMPLPPYIHHRLEDKDRYQTVYAKPLGSVAAPTAGLHFTEQLLQEIQALGVETHYVTLHVGLGTFRPVQVDTVEAHVMHEEVYEVTEEVAEALRRAKHEGRRIIAVGTTALRTLETIGMSGRIEAGSGETGIFIYPGYRFRVVDALITNFHLPKSTLLMLVSALAGRDFMLHAYKTAVEEEYRFFSFGDAMFIPRRCDE